MYTANSLNGLHAVPEPAEDADISKLVRLPVTAG